jgi:hypothetical protein
MDKDLLYKMTENIVKSKKIFPSEAFLDRMIEFLKEHMKGKRKVVNEKTGKVNSYYKIKNMTALRKLMIINAVDDDPEIIVYKEILREVCNQLKHDEQLYNKCIEKKCKSDYHMYLLQNREDLCDVFITGKNKRRHSKM